MSSTTDDDYAHRLARLQGARWKRVLHVQAPYLWQLRRQHLGRTLEIGCGVGRNLRTLAPGSLGVDHNPTTVGIARWRGFDAVTPEQFQARHYPPASFDGLLFSHVLEHVTAQDGERLLDEYLPFLRPGGRVFLVCPQRRGHDRDSSHVTYLDVAALTALARNAGLTPIRGRSFPLPGVFGGLFVYNESNVLAIKPVG